MWLSRFQTRRTVNMNSDEILTRAGLSLTEGMYVIENFLSFTFGKNGRKYEQSMMYYFVYRLNKTRHSKLIAAIRITNISTNT